MADKKSQEWLDKAIGEDLNKKCALLWNKGKGQPFCDTVLNMVGERGEVLGSFPVHKLILALGCRYFAKELFSSAPDEIPDEIPFNIEVHNSDVPTSMMELLLEFLYTDTIERHLDWIQVGGLIHISKVKDVPRLTQYCMKKFEGDIGERCEKVLELFRELITLSKKQFKWPETYYKEILKLCFSYILRNGEVIVRSSTFRNKFSIENLEAFIGSDYFCIPSEVLIYRGLNKWARAQCRKKRLDPYYIEDIKKMFRKPSEDEESIGLLKYVRFPVFTEDEFSCISQSSDLIMPKKIEELVHRYHVSEQPTGIFSEKRRPVTVDPGNDDFIKHIDQLISNLPAFTSSPTATCEDSSYLPSLQDDPIPMSSQSMNENQLNVITIKQEVDTDAQSCISSIPDHISVGTSATQNSPWSSLQNTPMDLSVQKRALKRTGNKAELTDTKKVSPMKIMKIKEEVEEKTEDNTCELESPVVNCTSTQKENDVPILKNEVISKKKVKYSEIVDNCSKNAQDITVFAGNHFNLVDLKANPKIQSVCMPRLISFSVEATLNKKTKDSLAKLLANINLEDFVFFYHDDSNPKNRLAQIWGKKIETTFKLSEVTVLHAHAGHNFFRDLTLNYTKKSSFFSLNGQGVLNDMNVLNLGNCKLNQEGWLKHDISEKLVELRLFRVKDLDLENGVILGQCKSLKFLCVWSVENQVPAICLNDIGSQNLISLSVAGYMIIFDPNRNSVFPKCKELCLMNYSCDPVFTEMISRTFPALQTLSIYNETYPPDTDFVLKIMIGSSLNSIFLWNFEETVLNGAKVSKLKSLIKNFGRIFKKGSSVQNCSFVLKRRTPVLWEGENLKMKDLPENVFSSFGLDCFYTFEAFKQLIWTNYI